MDFEEIFSWKNVFKHAREKILGFQFWVSFYNRQIDKQTEREREREGERGRERCKIKGASFMSWI